MLQNSREIAITVEDDAFSYRLGLALARPFNRRTIEVDQMDLLEALGQIFEIDVRAVAGAEHAQVPRPSRKLIHQAATMGAVPIRSVWGAAIHIVLRLANAACRLRRY